MKGEGGLMAYVDSVCDMLASVPLLERNGGEIRKGISHVGLAGMPEPVGDRTAIFGSYSRRS